MFYYFFLVTKSLTIIDNQFKTQQKLAKFSLQVSASLWPYICDNNEYSSGHLNPCGLTTIRNNLA